MRTDFHQSRRPGLCPALAGWQLRDWQTGHRREDRRSIARYWQHATRQTGSVKFKSWLIPSCQKSRSKLELFQFLISLINVNFSLNWNSWDYADAQSFLKSKSECMDLCIPFFSVCIDSRWYEICFLFCLYYTLNLDPFLPREFTNVKQLPIHFISFQRLFSSNKTQQQIWSAQNS